MAKKKEGIDRFKKKDSIYYRVDDEPHLLQKDIDRNTRYDQGTRPDLSIFIAMGTYMKMLAQNFPGFALCKFCDGMRGLVKQFPGTDAMFEDQWKLAEVDAARQLRSLTPMERGGAKEAIDYRLAMAKWDIINELLPRRGVGPERVLDRRNFDYEPVFPDDD